MEPYGAPQAKFPSPRELAEGKPGAFDAFGDAILQRSAAMPMTIWLKSVFQYRVLGRVDTDKVVSGRGDWLFYKEQFWGAACQAPDFFREPIAQLDALTEMAEAGGLPMVVSVSPDKASTYPEALSPEYRKYWDCKLANSDLWRRIALVEAPSLVDHRTAVLEAKAASPETKMFFYTDTHWSPLGAANAFRQLLRSWRPAGMVNSAILKVDGKSARDTDMANNMLLLGGQEEIEGVDDRIADLAQDTSNVVVLHDSFYRIIAKQLQETFPNYVDLSFPYKKDELGRNIAMADRLIVNSVERSFFNRLNSRKGGQALHSAGPLGQAVLARNATASKQCRDFGALDEPSSDTGITIPIPIGSAEMTSCLRIQLKDWNRDGVKLFLPDRGHAESPSHHSVTFMPAGSNTLTMVLPQRVKGRSVRLEVPEGVEIVSVALGERLQPSR